MEVLNETITYEQIGLDIGNYVAKRNLRPLLKWAGGKEQELKYIIPNLPESFDAYFEPFVGGGAVYTAVQAKQYFINDKSTELISLYCSITNENRKKIFFFIEKMMHNWGILEEILENDSVFLIKMYQEYVMNNNEVALKTTVAEFISSNQIKFNTIFDEIFDFNIENFIKEININLIRKIKRMKVLEKQKQKLPNKDILDNIETALKSAFYMHIRHISNNILKYNIETALRDAMFLFIRNFAYSGMFRYNANGDFNVPYGGIAYNNKNFLKKIDYLKSRSLKLLLENTTIENLDFEDFLHLHQPTENDFIFLDPPYDSEFSTYAQNEFTKEDQIRLANYLITDCKAKWMMIIKNTAFIYELYTEKGLNIRAFDKTYLVSFMNRNDKNVEHLIITNY